MFEFNKQAFVVFISFRESSTTKCISLNIQIYINRPKLTDLNPDELDYQVLRSFMITLGRLDC